MKPTNPLLRLPEEMMCILCTHLAEGADARYVRLDAPVDDTDSGWVFSCGEEEHEDEEWMAAGANEAAIAIPAIERLEETPVLTMPVGHHAWVDSEGSWHLAPAPDADEF